MTKVLVIGSGGREHALVWKLAQTQCKVYCAPGNGGISQLAHCIPISADNISELLAFVKKENVDLTIVGPELPLSLGIVDEFQEAGYKIFGPTKNAAQLETSKAFARKFCSKYNLPAPNFEIFNDSKRAISYLETKEFPVVIKVSGLAQGKGVFIVQSLNEAHSIVKKILENRIFGEEGNTIVIEDFIEGKEISLLTLCDGEKIIPCIPARDHKPLYDGNKGPNTGGMGTYAPVPELDEKWTEKIENELLTPLLEALKKENIEYHGVLYIGLMIKEDKPYILEFNCRWGDPEAEVLLPLLKNDLVEICINVIEGHLSILEWKKLYALTVIMASGGYPGKYETGKIIKGNLADNDNTLIFHCGTKRIDHSFYTSGGRVLAITGIGATLAEARKYAYQRVSEINFENMYYRNDIGVL
ncbi:MAG: phosphoribosylamine--glycine ligase [candidate division WOR-3 bacterium]|nr:phosphoribosylamine--glycine ligase [candidate division WOR-3 bacterium]